MTYTQIGIAMVVAAIAADVLVLRTRLVTRRGFWVAYAIVLFFQLLTNGVLTALHVFRYSDSVIVGGQPIDDGTPPPFIGEGRIAFQPFEDLLMGFSLCLLAMALWIYWGRRGVQRTPMSGPPIWRRSARLSGGSADGAPPSAAGAQPGRAGDGEAST
jgi:lycopene cyclase domain-containing protein